MGAFAWLFPYLESRLTDFFSFSHTERACRSALLARLRDHSSDDADDDGLRLRHITRKTPGPVPGQSLSSRIGDDA